MIYKREEYIEETGENAKFPVKSIEVLTALEGGTKVYVGRVTLGLQTPLGVQQIPVTFDIQASSVPEAFQKFDAAAEPRIEEARKSLEEELRKVRDESSRRIVRPGEVGMGGVVDINKLKQ